MHRRTFLGTAAAALSAPAVAAPARVLRFIPEADLAITDPVWTTANVTRDHAGSVFDTLYGLDEQANVQPQMVLGHQVDADRTIWTIRLRPGLRFHDGTPVLAADVVPSIRRWAQRAPFGQALMRVTDELVAISDDTLRLRLKHPFPVERALANGAPVMPARLSGTDAATRLQDVVGSGPYRFVAGEQIAGARAVYERFADYVARPDGTPSFTAGPKIAYLDRIEWNVIPDPATAASAMMAGEADWWSAPSYDLVPKLRASKNLDVQVVNTAGAVPIIRFNHLNPPFDNPAVRRAVLPAIDQAAFMQGIISDDESFWKTGVGAFALESPMASDAGLSALTGPRSLEAAKRALAASGYKGERVVVLSAADTASDRPRSLITADLLDKIGFKVDLQTMDWGTLIQRRSKMEPPDQGGWSVVTTSLNADGIMHPASHIGLRSDGRAAWPGWPESPRMEALRAQWLETDDAERQKAICRDIQTQFFQDVQYVPLGEAYGPYAFAKRVTNIPRGFPLFYGVRIE